MKNPKKMAILLLIFLIVLISSASAVYFYSKYQSAKKLLENSNKAVVNERDILVKEVGQLMELPKEDPTIATVSDKTKLKNQPFFSEAENGDKVLIFTQAKRAILYRPSTNKIIEIAPINIGQTSQASPSGQTQQASPSGRIIKPVKKSQ